MKTWVWAIGSIIIVAIGGGIYLVTQKDDKGGSTTSTVATGDQADAGATKAACDIFTDAVAKQVLGEGAVKSEVPGGGAASTETVSVTQCMYEVGEGRDITVANLLVRAAKNKDAYESNRFGFESTKTQGGSPAEDIGGLGQAAYFNTSFKQTNVLVNDGQYWIIIQAGNTRQMSEQLAREVVKNL